MIGMLIFGLLRLPRPADAPAEPPPAATAAAIQPDAAGGQAAESTGSTPIRPVSRSV
jgi:hypothetical protein